MSTDCKTTETGKPLSQLEKHTDLEYSKYDYS